MKPRRIHNSILCLAFHFRLSKTAQIWNANIAGLAIRKVTGISPLRDTLDKSELYKKNYQCFIKYNVQGGNINQT